MKDKKKCFAIDDLGYEPEAVAIHPGGGTAAVGGTVRLHVLKLALLLMLELVTEAFNNRCVVLRGSRGSW